MITEIKAVILINPKVERAPFSLSNHNESKILMVISFAMVIFIGSLFAARLALMSTLQYYRLQNNTVLTVMLIFWLLSFEVISFFIYINFEQSSDSLAEYDILKLSNNEFALELVRRTALLIMPDKETFHIGKDARYLAAADSQKEGLDLDRGVKEESKLTISSLINTSLIIYNKD